MGNFSVHVSNIVPLNLTCYNIRAIQKVKSFCIGLSEGKIIHTYLGKLSCESFFFSHAVILTSICLFIFFSTNASCILIQHFLEMQIKIDNL